MVPQGPSAPLGGSQPGPPSLLRSGSGMLSRQGSGMPSQNAFPSLVSPHNQFSNLNNMLGSNNNVSSLLHQSSFGNGTTSSGPGNSQRGLIDGGAESGPLSSVGNGMGFNNPSSSSYMSGQVQGQQQFLNSMLTDQQQAQQLEQHSFQHNNQQSQQFQTMRAGLGGAGPVKMEPQITNEQTSQQQYQALRNMGSVKMEPQQLQSMRGLGPVKLEPQHSDPSFLHQQQQQQQQQQHQHQQQQQQMMMSRQSSQAAAAAQILHQQRFMQIQDQQQQQQLLKSMPQQRPQQFQQQNLPVRSPMKPVYEPGMCARRLTHYMYQQQHRPEDNSIEFWRKFVAEYFAPNARKKWCVSMYGSGRQTTGVFPQDVWHCEICNRKPGRGFEATVEVLPRLYKIKYESGTLEELLYVDMPREYQNPSGQIVLDYAKAIQESVFEQLRVVRDGQLRIVFSPDLKICSWEFCARRHEELIPRRILVPQVSQLGTAAQKYQAATQNTSSPGPSVPELQNNCNMFVASARQLVKTLEVPLVNDLGYTKRYVRCLQISEVVNSMKDLIDYNRDTGVGPMESLAKYPRRTNSSPSFRGQSQQPESQHQQQQQQQATGQNSNNGNSSQPAHVQLASTSAHSTPINSGPTTSSNNNIANLVHQNSMNSRPQNPISNMNASYGGNSVQMPSPGGSSNTMPHNNNPSPSPFQSPTPSSSNNNNIINSQPTSQNHTLSGAHINSASSPNISIQQQPVLSNEADPNDSQSSVQKIINDMMMSSQLGGDMKINNRDLSTSGNPGNILLGTGVANGNHNNIGVSGFGGIQNRLVGQSGMVNGNRMAFVNNNNNNNSLSMNGRVGMQTIGRDQRMNSQQQDMSNQLLSSLGAVNGFNNLQFDWKASP